MEIEEAAADWAVRVDNAPLDPADQARLDAWLDGDTRHLGAYARASAMLVHARRAKAFGADFDPDAFTGLDRGDRAANVQPLAAAPTRRRFVIGGSTAAAGLVAAAVGLSWPAAAETYSTRRGEIRLIPLSDGSAMTLNTASTARVSYTADARRVELVEGEALFDVLADAARPFVVTAGDTRIRALGTSFSVRRLADTPVEVVVRNGLVTMQRPGSVDKGMARVGANMRATAPVAETAPLVTTTLPPVEVGRALAWRSGMLSFEDVPLAQAIDEFARYSDVRIRLADQAIGTKTVTGLFAATNPAGFAKTVAISLNLRVERGPDGVILRH